IVVTSRRPPPTPWTDSRIHFVAVDFLDSQERAVEALRLVCRDVTHAYFASYIHDDDLAKLPEKNVPLFKNFMDVVDQVCPRLQRVCLQTGGKHYGVHLGPTAQPVSEDIPRYADDNGLNFYYQQEDHLLAAQQQRRHHQNQWSYNIIRPFGIIGFHPTSNGMSMAITLAVYILISLESSPSPSSSSGQTTTNVPPFPGSQAVLDFPDDVSFAPSLADLTVWASTHDRARDEAFNHASGDPVVWRYFWPRLAARWSIGGGGEVRNYSPQSDDGNEEVSTLRTSVSEWARDKRPVWDRVVRRYGGRPDAFDWCSWSVLDWGYVRRDWPVLPSAAKARACGWTRWDRAMDGWEAAFAAFEDAGILPRAAVVREAVAGGGSGGG
ncbi:hypothetical protein SLS58_010476, partial [Diplodia intermedia]